MKYEIKSRKKPEIWEDGYFTGNGTIGAVVMCNPQNETLIINHEELFLPTTDFGELPEMSDVFLKVRENPSPEMSQYFYNISRERGLKNKVIEEDTTLYPDCFFPAFAVNIACDGDEKSEYERILDTANGEIRVHCKPFTERVFTSRKSNCVCFYISTENKTNFTVKADMLKAQNTKEQLFLDKCIKAVHKKTENNEIQLQIKMNKGFYSGAVRAFSDGTPAAKDGKLIFENAGYVFLTVSAAVNENVEVKDIKSYDTELEGNLDLYHELFSCSSIELEENKYFDEYTEKLFKAKNDDEKISALMQKLYYMGRYFAISSFGKLPPNAQGLWNGSIDGRLWCDYISNIELEMALWSVFSGNFSQLALKFFDFFEKYIPDFEENARKIFGMKGIMITSRFTNCGLLFHFSPNYTHHFWIAGGAWISHIYFEYYLYTGDIDFLKNRALPIMKLAANFYMDYIKAGEIIPSVSPENTPYQHIFCMIGKNAAMDISAIKELFANIKKSCEILNMPCEYEINLPQYMYESDGTLCEWADIMAAKSYSHRHLSQCYAVMPGYEAKNDKKLFDGIKKSVEKRIENGFFDISKDTCGWSVMHLINIYARLRNGEGLKKAMRFFTEHFVRENLITTLNPDHTRFQIDANLGFVNAMYEMLVYSEPGKVILFPCEEILTVSGEAKNILLRGSALITELKWDSDNILLKIESDEDKVTCIEYKNETQKIYLNNNKIIKFKRRQKND